jgi:hypothetical protein
MNLFDRTRATKLWALDRKSGGQRRAGTIALVLSVSLFAFSSLASVVSAESVDSLHATRGIAGDSKQADKEAKKKERAAAREAKEAKKKERAAKSKASDDDRSYAKATKSKSRKGSDSKSERSSDVDLGDDDPLEGL